MLFVPGLEEVALGGDLVAAYFLAQIYEIGIGVERDRARAYALIRWSYEHGGTRAIEQYGNHLREWLVRWDEDISGDERERALCLISKFHNSRTPDGENSK
jgi:TPR repeat protein